MTGRWEVVVTETCYLDLREAARYVRDQPRSPDAASGLVDAFEEQVASLETFPEGCPPVADHELVRRGYRWVPVGNFMLFYTTDAQSGTVYGERLLYGARDWQSLL